MNAVWMKRATTLVLDRTGASRRRGLMAIASLAAAMTGCQVFDYSSCAEVDQARLARLPRLLSQTGLFADAARGILAPGVMAFAPQFPLWSDGAQKRRWISLPAGSRIDTSDMDAWRFPQGTKLWKEFARDGVRVETRLLEKTGPGPEDWVAMSFAWNGAGTDAEAVPAGRVNARGTGHDVPAADRCVGCHGGRKSHVLGFSAIQLSNDGAPGSVNLRELGRRGLLTVAPAANYVVPGNATEKAALGYLHANCSHCHNQDRPATGSHRCYNPYKDFDFSLRVQDLGDVQQTGVYRTALGSAIAPGNAAESELIRRVSVRDRRMPSMPPLGTDVVDAHGVALLRGWIDGMPGAR